MNAQLNPNPQNISLPLGPLRPCVPAPHLPHAAFSTTIYAWMDAYSYREVRASYKKLERLDIRLQRAKAQREAAAAAAAAAAMAEDADESEAEPVAPTAPARVTRGQLEEAAKVKRSDDNGDVRETLRVPIPTPRSLSYAAFISNANSIAVTRYPTTFPLAQTTPLPLLSSPAISFPILLHDNAFRTLKQTTLLASIHLRGHFDVHRACCCRPKSRRMQRSKQRSKQHDQLRPKRRTTASGVVGEPAACRRCRRRKRKRPRQRRRWLQHRPIMSPAPATSKAKLSPHPHQHPQ